MSNRKTINNKKGKYFVFFSFEKKSPFNMESIDIFDFFFFIYTFSAILNFALLALEFISHSFKLGVITFLFTGCNGRFLLP